jgi:hypothetical protein
VWYPYGHDDPAAAIDEIAALLRAGERHASSGRLCAVAIFDELMRRMADHGGALRGAAHCWSVSRLVQAVFATKPSREARSDRGSPLAPVHAL